jgi:hypothetical protein
MLDSDVENVAKRRITQMGKAGRAAGYQWLQKKALRNTSGLVERPSSSNL